MGYNPDNNTFTTLSDLALQVGTANTVAQVLGGTIFNDGGGGSFYWDSTSTAAADGSKIIQVTGVTTGRWMRAKSNTYGGTSITFSGVTLVTTYTVNHGQGFTPSQIQLQAASPGASSTLNYVLPASITATTFQVVFTGIPAIGVNNITFMVLIVR